jgi:hypothetical protein
MQAVATPLLDATATRRVDLLAGLSGLPSQVATLGKAEDMGASQLYQLVGGFWLGRFVIIRQR